MAVESIANGQEACPSYSTFDDQNRTPDSFRCDSASSLCSSDTTTSLLKPSDALQSPPARNHTHGLQTVPPLSPASDKSVALNTEDAYQSNSPLLDLHPPSKSYEASILILISTMCMSVVSCIIRHLTVECHIPSSFMAFYRGFVQLVIVSGIILAVGPQKVVKRPTRKQWTLLLIRGVMSGAGINIRYAALTKLPVGIATSLISTSPIFASLLAWVVLGQSLTPIDIVSLCCTTIGSATIGLANPDPKQTTDMQAQVHVEGVLLALSTAVIGASVFVILRSLGTSVHFLLSCVFSGFFFMLGSLFAMLVQTNDIKHDVMVVIKTVSTGDLDLILGLVGVAVLGVGSGLMMNRGAQLIAPGRAGVLRTSEVPINFLLAFLFLGEFPSSIAILAGCLLIVMSTMLTAFKGTS